MICTVLLAINTVMLLGISAVIGVFLLAARQADRTRQEFDRADRIVSEADEAVRSARASRAG